MDVTPLIREGQQIIQSYTAGAFRVSGISYDTAVLVSPLNTQEWPDISVAGDISADSFSPLLPRAQEIDVVLLGTGDEMIYFDPAFIRELSKQGLQVEVMSTGAACRTYNVLLAEDRRVVAALVPTSKNT